MRLWDYLKCKMSLFPNRVAFANSGITYEDLLHIKARKAAYRMKICESSTREGQALQILKALAEGDVAVPVSYEYGANQYRRIKEIVDSDKHKYRGVAFCIFTSGTTGKPKGVFLTNKNIICNLEYIAEYFCLKNERSICIARPLAHIAVLTGELLYALINGLTIFFYEESFMPHRLARFLNENKIDVFCATPTIYSAIAKIRRNNSLPVKIGAISGERLLEKNAFLIAECFKETKFYNVYGLTEHSPRAFALKPEEFLKKAGSIGHPIGKVKAKIKKGELLLKSPCVAKGYYGGEKLKIRRRWLCTGDAAYKDADGFYYICGRIDDMIIRGGINIYPQEIEGVLKQFPGVEECRVSGEEDERFGQRIIAEIKGNVSFAEVRLFAAAHLPLHMLPDEYRKTLCFEYTPSGKIVRRNNGFKARAVDGDT